MMKAGAARVGNRGFLAAQRVAPVEGLPTRQTFLIKTAAGSGWC